MPQPIASLDLSHRAHNALIAAGMTTIEQIPYSQHELSYRIVGIGPTSAREIIRKLDTYHNKNNSNQNTLELRSVLALEKIAHCLEALIKKQEEKHEPKTV